MNNQVTKWEKVSECLSILPECISYKRSSRNSLPDYCATVHKGSFTDKNNSDIYAVAVKKYQNNESGISTASTYERVIETLKFLSLPGNKHPNFIRFFEDDSSVKELGEAVWLEPPQQKRKRTTKDEFKYLITELCICSVGDLISEKRVKMYNFGGRDISAQDILKALPHKEILKQSTEAVNFLHGLGLIHRNLHPDNFLIQQITGDNNQFIIKLTDFQLSKDWEKDIKMSKSFSWSDWIVPEHQGAEALSTTGEDSKTDVFIMGCYFYYVLTGGLHPFGRSFDDRRRNIRDGAHIIYQKDSSAWNPLDKLKAALSDETERKNMIQLIRNMIRFHSSDRVSMWQVLEDEFFYPHQPHYNIYDNALKISPEKPGLCVIICQEKFERDPLTGINNDASQLRRTFARFGYDVLLYNNLKSDEMKNNLQPNHLAKQLGQENLDIYASLAICILSHGDKGVVLGVDCLPVPINDLRNTFSSYNCPAMAGKPKMFIIFACQGINDQIAITDASNELGLLEDVEMAGNNNQPVGVTANSDGSPPVSDFLFLISSIEDFYSYYIPGVGSPFISHLCGAMMSEYGNNNAENPEKESHKRDLVNLFTSAVAPRLGRWVIRKSETITVRQTPELRSSLTKTIRFRAKQPTHVIANQIKEEAALMAQNGRNDPSAPVKFIYSDKS